MIPVVARIAAYAEQWIRLPERWQPCDSPEPREILRSLLEHLFASWPLPSHFDSAWYAKGDLKLLERDWYCRVACGEGLRNLPGMPPSITSRALHLAKQAPEHLTIRQALRWGQVKAMGGTDELLAEVLSHRMVVDLSNDSIWSRLLKKVIAAGNFRAADFSIIADALVMLLSQDKWMRATALVGLPLPELLNHGINFWNTILKFTCENLEDIRRSDVRCPKLRSQLHQAYAAFWPAMLGSDFDYGRHRQDGTRNWRVEELTHPHQLIAEGKAMRHCVATYGSRCRKGESAIFSLRSHRVESEQHLMERHLTIEVNPRSRRVVQVRGRRDKRVHPGEFEAFRQWLKKFQLTY